MTRSDAYLVHLALVIAAAALIWRTRDAGRSRRARPWLAVAGLAAIVSFAVWSWGRATPFGDFDKAYFPAGRLVLSAPERLYTCDIDTLCFVNLPIVAVLFSPLSGLSPIPARAVFTMAGAAAVSATGWLLLRTAGVSGWRANALAAVLFLNGPLYYSARLGNLSHLLLLPLVLALRALVSGRDHTAGAWLAVVSAIKPPMLLFLPYLILRRRWTAAATMAFIILLVVVASILWLGTELHRTWLRDYVIGFGARPLAAYNVQSISGALARLVAPGHTTDWRPLDLAPGFAWARYGLTAICVFAVLAVCGRVGRPATEAGWWSEWSLVLILALLASPITWTHYYCVLLIPLTLYIGGKIAVPDRPAWAAAIAAAGLIVSLPVVLPRPTYAPVVVLTERVLLSHYVGGAIALLGILLIGMRRSVVKPPTAHPISEAAAGR
jgi:hypothetical protein